MRFEAESPQELEQLGDALASLAQEDNRGPGLLARVAGGQQQLEKLITDRMEAMILRHLGDDCLSWQRREAEAADADHARELVQTRGQRLTKRLVQHLKKKALGLLDSTATDALSGAID
jgi:hypothetical protein